MSNDHGQTVLVIGVAFALAVWLITLVVWLIWRRPGPMKTVKRRVSGVGPEPVRDLLPKAAALMNPVWDLVGGDARRAEFDVPLLGRQRVVVELEQSDDAVTMRCDATPVAGWTVWVVPVCLVVQPLVIFGLGYVLWINVNTNAAPGSGGRAYQVVQLVHILWPPFMFMGIGWSLKKQLRQRCERFATTVELLLAP